AARRPRKAAVVPHDTRGRRRADPPAGKGYHGVRTHAGADVRLQGRETTIADEETAMLRNRRATHEYEILETFEAGLELTGSEVKSLRAGGGSIAEAFARVQGGEVFLEGMTIPPYKDASYNNHEPNRRRRLLL